MKNPLVRINVLALTLAIASLGEGSAEVLMEDFESYPVGSPAAEAGWRILVGAGDIENAMIESPTPSAPDIGSRVLAILGGGNSQYIKSFRDQTGFTDHTPTIVYTAKFFPMVTGKQIQNIRFGVETLSGKTMTPFGILQGTDGEKQFFFTLGDAQSSEMFPSGSWYELRMILDQSQGIERATATLQVRDLESGGAFVPVPGLENIPLTLDRELSAASWSSWLIRSQYRQQIAELKLSTEIE